MSCQSVQLALCQKIHRPSLLRTLHGPLMSNSLHKIPHFWRAIELGRMTLPIQLRDMFKQPWLHSLHILGFLLCKLYSMRISIQTLTTVPSINSRPSWGRFPELCNLRTLTPINDLDVTKKCSMHIEHREPTHHIGNKNKM